MLLTDDDRIGLLQRAKKYHEKIVEKLTKSHNRCRS
jgi:hypothetical protein